MIRRTVSSLLLIWILGFLWFAIFLPQPLADGHTDGVVVPTGGGGRIERGLQAIRQGYARTMLVSGVDPEVKPREFAAEYKVPARMMRCCITLGFESVDTRSNGQEAARWIAKNRYTSVRLVTTDWHMRRAAFELSQAVPDTVTILRDAVPSRPSLRILFLEYNKMLARLVATLWEK